MACRKRRDKNQDIPEFRQEEDNPEEKQEVIVACEHVFCPKLQIFPISCVKYALLVFVRHAVR